MTTEPASIDRGRAGRRRALAALRTGGASRAGRFVAGLAARRCFVLAVITLGPTIYLLVTSLTPLDPVHPEQRARFLRPARQLPHALSSDARFVNSVWVQPKLSVATVALQLALGLGVALLLNAGSRFLEAVRTAFSCRWCCRRSSWR